MCVCVCRSSKLCSSVGVHGHRAEARSKVKALQAMKKKLARLTAEQKFHIDEIAERKGMLAKTEADIVKVILFLSCSRIFERIATTLS